MFRDGGWDGMSGRRGNKEEKTRKVSVDHDGHWLYGCAACVLVMDGKRPQSVKNIGPLDSRIPGLGRCPLFTFVCGCYC